MPSSSSTPVRLGCIGCGNMGGAILSGLLRLPHITLCGYDTDPEVLDSMQKNGIIEAASIGELVQQCDIIVVAVKPAIVPNVLFEAAPLLNRDKIVVSIAAGVAMQSLETFSGHTCPVVRVMPNTPAMVGAGTFALCLDDPRLTELHKTTLRQIFESLGMVMVLPEDKFNAFTAVAGCGPAYVFHFMDAMTEAAVTLGFARPQAQKMVTELFSGCAKLAAQPGAHLPTLREQVCSPGGITIAATNYLERNAVRGHIIDAVLTAAAKGCELEKAK